MIQEAEDLAATIADEFWDRFEVEIDKTVGDEFLYDMASPAALALSLAVMPLYDETFARYVDRRLEKLEEAMQVALGGQDGFDAVNVGLKTLRKGIKFSRHAQQEIEAAFARAKPGLGRVLENVLGDLLREPDEQMDDLDKQMRRDAERVKRELYAIKERLLPMLVEETPLLVKQAARAYRDWLDAQAQRHAEEN